MYIKLVKPVKHFHVFILFWTSIILFSCSLNADAKAVLYDGRDGLNSNDIGCIEKDNRGLMWLGTANGLNIFDGYTFTKFEGELSNKPIGLVKMNPANNQLSVITGAGTGLFLVELNTLVTRRIKLKGVIDPYKKGEQIRALCYNSYDKTIYYACKNAIYKIDENYAFVKVCSLSDPHANIDDMELYDKDHFLINNGSLSIINIRTGESRQLNTLKNLRGIMRIYKTADKILVSDSLAQLFSSNSKALEQNGEATPQSAILRLLQIPVVSCLKGNKFYCLSENYAFLVYDLKTGSIDTLSQKYPDIFEGKVFYSIFVDENDLIWIGTNKGLIKVEERTTYFSKILHNFPERISTRKIFEDNNGDYYVCSYAGLMYLPKGSQQWQRYYSNNKNPAALHTFSEVVYPQCIFPASDDFFYIGADDPSLFTFNKKTKAYDVIDLKYTNPADKLNSIFDFAEDANGIIWMGGYNGIATFNPHTNIATAHHSDKFSIGDSRLRMFLSNKAQNLMYVASSSGLYIFDINKGLLKHFTTTSTPAISNNDVLYVGKDKQGNIWLGTNGDGINIISPDLKTIKYIRKQDGLSSEVVYSILPENDNVLWIPTFNGLDRYQIDKKMFTNFFEEDGISSNEFNQNSFYKARDGKFYFGSINGVTTFYPQQSVQQNPFNIYFAGVSKWDAKTQAIHLLFNNLPEGSTISKSPSDELIELHFGCTDYSDPQRNSYSYRIKEISNNWISLDDHHSLSIGGLPYGVFTLEIKAINARGATSANTLLYYLEIQQPFYRTWWFFALILVFVMMIFYAAYLIKSHNFKKVLHLRMKIASNLHDEVGSLLTRITMFSDNLRYSKNNEEQRNIKLEKIAVLSRNAVASMSDVLWAIDSRNDFAGNLVDRMREQAEEMLFPLGIDVNFVLLVNDLKKPIHSDIRGEVYLIFKEAINNIVKHSNATEVEITYQLVDKHFYLKISNNGIIESVSDVSTGQGLNNMKMRAKKIGAKIRIERKGDIFLVELNN